MATAEELGEMQRVGLGTVWPRELDFSRWLAGHIDLLDEQVNWSWIRTLYARRSPRVGCVWICSWTQQRRIRKIGFPS